MAKKIKRKKLNFAKFMKFIGVFVVLSYVLCTLIHQKISLNERMVAVRNYENQISAAKLEQQTLKSELDKVNTDEYLEKLAREKLGLIKPNDRVFVDVTKN